MNLRSFHRTSAIAIAVFAVFHIANHLMSLLSIPAHMAAMKAFRAVYRQGAVEVILLLCVAFQVASGLWFVMRDWKQKQGLIPWLQAISGLYLVFFLLVHVSAVMFARSVLNLDTNFYFAAAGFYAPPYQFFFAPYYFLAVLALFTHLGCAAYWQCLARPRTARILALALPIGIGGTMSLLIVLSLAGLIRPIEIPAKYKSTYASPNPEIRSKP
ncbi:MAG: hypothetical protein V4634_04085 [Pseudomonadota bacterium]